MDVLSELILESLLGESMTQKHHHRDSHCLTKEGLFCETMVDKSLPPNTIRVGNQLFVLGPSTPGKRNIPPNQSTFDYLMYGESSSTPDQGRIDPILVVSPPIRDGDMAQQILNRLEPQGWHWICGNDPCTCLCEECRQMSCICEEGPLIQAKYGKDHGEKITIGEIVDQLRQLPNGNEFRDKVDELFFDGAWPNDDSGQKICETFKRDIAGILHNALHKQDNSAKWKGFVPVPKEELNKLIEEHALYESRFRRIRDLVDAAHQNKHISTEMKLNMEKLLKGIKL